MGLTVTVNTHAFQDAWTYTKMPTILLDRKIMDGFMEGASAIVRDLYLLSCI